MKITNLTSKEQTIQLLDYYSRESYTVSILPNSTTEIEHSRIDNMKELEGKIEVGEKSPSEAPVAPIEVEEAPAEVVAEAAEEVTHEALPDKFICEICGSEFASMRGLTSHKNRVHAE